MHTPKFDSGLKPTIPRRVSWGFKWLRGLSRGGRNFGIYPDDTFVVSYPKSGNTWTRFLLANLVYCNEDITFSNIERKIPDPSMVTRADLERVPRPRIVKSHEYFDPRYKRVIYIVLDLFVRAAVSGQWQAVLSESMVAEIESAWGHTMRAVGYKLAASAEVAVPSMGYSAT